MYKTLSCRGEINKEEQCGDVYYSHNSNGLIVYLKCKIGKGGKAERQKRWKRRKWNKRQKKENGKTHNQG